MKFFFSFGFGHEHDIRLNGVSVHLDRDALVMIEADDAGLACHKMFELFGNKWGMQYAEDRVDMSYYPSGVVLELKA